MKKLLLAAALLTGIYSCSEDFEVAAPYQDYTFVYSLLNITDTAHYIRVQKAFLDEKKSAFDMATIPDSSFYDNLNIYILALNDAGGRVDSFNLSDSLVNMTNEGYPKDSGTFFTEPNYAYKFKRALNASYTYRLVVANPESGNTGSSDIKLINGLSSAFNFEQNEIDFSRTVNSQNGRLITTDISSGIPEGVAFADAVIRFRYVEEANGVLTDKFVDLTLPSVVIGQNDGSATFEVVNRNVYNFLATSIGPASPGVARYIDSCDVFFNIGASEFYDYIQTQQLGGGLTGDLSRPLYTNFSGKNVYGVFSSRATKTEFDVPVSPAMFDSLRSNPITVPLNIAGRSPR